ncbi:hypothetical protein T4D_3604 [Trichinella pseudospiralis]|uniref:Uncharacterized protein n=1 Tax=Trichinella pseudospiralis TaxID=6337 RepID=A0A0V1F3J9_TRIPS|nr:hypothetical protein T4D_3604 [Trichinella pseudospiralis]
MSQPIFKTFDSWVFCWVSTQLVWFILMDFLFSVTIKVIFNTIMGLLCRMNICRNPNLVENEVGVWKFQSMTMAESDPRVRGKASHKTCLNITDVISALSTKIRKQATRYNPVFKNKTNPSKAVICRNNFDYLLLNVDTVWMTPMRLAFNSQETAKLIHTLIWFGA